MAYEAICLLADKGHFGAWTPGAEKKPKSAARGKRHAGAASMAKRQSERLGDSEAPAAPSKRHRPQRQTPAHIGHK